MIRACDTGRDPTGSRPAVTPQHTPTIGISAKKLAQHTPSSGISAKNSPSTPENADLGPFFVRWANFSRTGHGHVPTLKPMTPLQPLMQASMKPPAPLLAPKKRPLKPATPLQPKNAPKTPISRPQRRRRFQSRLGRHPQRRQGFQTIGPAGRQGLAAVRVGGGGAWPGNTQAPRPIGGRREACGAWPGFEPTRRAKLAARTASGRAAAHGRWRGLAGLRDDAPSEARGADGERAGRPRGGRRSVGATSNTKPPGPTGGRAAHASGR